jgi:hypothetical protein
LIMKKISYIMILLSLVGCTSLNIKSHSIENIIIEDTDSDLRINISDKSQISQLLKYINSSSRDFYIFKPNYTLTISYGDKTIKKIFLKDEMLKIEGVTYRTSKQLSVIIETYLRNDTRDSCM